MHRKVNDSDNFAGKYNMETSKELFEDIGDSISIKNNEKKLEKNDLNDGSRMRHMTRKMFED